MSDNVTVTVTIGASGKKRVSVSPTTQATNENDQATFCHYRKEEGWQGKDHIPGSRTKEVNNCKG